jgi:hypothetical protein
LDVVTKIGEFAMEEYERSFHCLNRALGAIPVFSFYLTMNVPEIVNSPGIV